MKDLLYAAVKILIIATLINGLYYRFAKTNDTQKTVPIIIISDDKNEIESVSPLQKNTKDIVLSPPGQFEDNNINLKSSLPEPSMEKTTSQQYIKSANHAVFKPGEAQHSTSPSNNKLTNTQEPYFSCGPAQ